MDRVYVFELQQILDYIEQNFRKNIGVNEIAREVGYSPRHCNRLFKEYFGDTLASYLRRRRMDAAKTDLKNGSVGQVAKELSFDSPDGFSRAFQSQFGITPSLYVKGGALQERYVKLYEYRGTPEVWGAGQNPTPDGLWEFGYYDPATERYSLMKWTGYQFEAPYSHADRSDPHWYCRNRMNGYGMHPALGLQAVRSFVCPHPGTVEVFFSVGRISKVFERATPCSARLFHNDRPLFPSEGAAVMDTSEALFLTGTCAVCAGDRIRLHIDSMGDMARDGVMLYRQRIGYLKISDGEAE